MLVAILLFKILFAASGIINYGDFYNNVLKTILIRNIILQGTLI